MFGYGSILVVGSGGTKDKFEPLAQPLVFRHHVQQQREDKARA